jgi:hypothetical protein
MEQNEGNRSRQDFTSLSNRVEQYMKKGIIILTILLCLSQLLLQFPSARHWLTTTDHSEGVPFHYISH